MSESLYPSRPKTSGVFAQLWRSAPDPAVGLRHLDGHSGDLQRTSKSGLFDIDDHLPDGEVLIRQNVLNVIGRAERQLPAEERAEFLLGEARRHPSRLAVHELLVGHARLARRRPRIVDEVATLDQGAEDAPEFVSVGSHRDPAVGGRKEAEDGEHWMPIALRARDDAVHRTLIHNALAQREDDVGHCDVDQLASSRTLRAQERANHAIGRHRPRHDVANARPNLHRRTGVWAIDADDAANRLSDDIIGLPVRVWAASGRRIAEATNAGVDEPRIISSQDVKRKAQSIHDSDAEVLDDGVRVAAEINDDVAPLVGL